MAITNAPPLRTTTLAAIKLASSGTDGEKSDSNHSNTQTPIVISAGVQQLDAQTTVRTMVLTNDDSSLPNMSLEDVLERSGVELYSQIVLGTINDEVASATLSSTTTDDGHLNALRTAVDVIESADAVVVEVETSSNNVQTVKVRAADIEVAYAHATAQPANTTTQSLSNFLLLRNGWAYTALESSPLDLPIEPLNQQAGDGWAPWRSLEDGVHEIQDIANGTWNRLVGQLVDTSPKPLSTLAGVFKYSTTDEQLLSTVTTSDTLELSSTGVFTSTRSVLASGGMLSLETSFVSHSFRSAKGTSSSHPSDTDQTDNISSTLLDNSNKLLSQVADDMFGAYQMLEDGMTLELHYADGTTERKLFLTTRNGAVSISGKDYYRAANASPNLLDNLMALLTNSGVTDKRGEWLKSLADSLRKSSEGKAKNAGGTVRSAGGESR